MNNKKQKQRAEDLKKILGDVQSAGLTAEKAAQIENTYGDLGKYNISGFILCNGHGNRVLVEMSAVRWLNKEEMQWLMHEAASPINKKHE